MQIIKSKYSSKELFELYKKEEANVDKKAKSIIDMLQFDSVGVFSVIFIYLVMLLPITMIVRFSFNDGNPIPAFENTVFGILIVFLVVLLGFLLPFRDKIIDRLEKRYQEQGRILDFPLNGYYWVISFIKAGEEIFDFLAENPDVEVIYEKDSPKEYHNLMTFFVKNQETGLLEEREKYDFDGYDANWKNFNLKPGVFDFSIYDEYIEAALEKGN